MHFKLKQSKVSTQVIFKNKATLLNTDLYADIIRKKLFKSSRQLYEHGISRRKQFCNYISHKF